MVALVFEPPVTLRDSVVTPASRQRQMRDDVRPNYAAMALDAGTDDAAEAVNVAKSYVSEAVCAPLR